MKRNMAGKSISLRAMRVLLPHLARKTPLNFPLNSFVPPARVRKNPSVQGVEPVVQSEGVKTRLSDKSRPVYFSCGNHGRPSSGKQVIRVGTRAPVVAASRSMVFVPRGTSVGKHVHPSFAPVRPKVRNGQLRKAGLNSEIRLCPVPGLSRQRIQAVIEGQRGTHLSNVLPVASRSPASPMLQGSDRERPVFSRRLSPVLLSKITRHRFFSTRQEPINVRQSRNGLVQADGMDAAPTGIVRSVMRLRSIRQEAVSLVPDFLGALRRDHALARQSGTLQAKRSTAVDRTGHFGDIMEMPRGQEKASDLSDESFRMNALRTRSAAVDEIAVPQYPNMSFGFM